MKVNVKRFEKRVDHIWQKYKEHILKLEQGKEANTEFIRLVEECLGFQEDNREKKREKTLEYSTITVEGKKELVYRKIPKAYEERLVLFIVYYGTTDHDI